MVQRPLSSIITGAPTVLCSPFSFLHPIVRIFQLLLKKFFLLKIFYKYLFDAILHIIGHSPFQTFHKPLKHCPFKVILRILQDLFPDLHTRICKYFRCAVRIVHLNTSHFRKYITGKLKCAQIFFIVQHRPDIIIQILFQLPDKTSCAVIIYKPATPRIFTDRGIHLLFITL